MSSSKKDKEVIRIALVTEALPNTEFRVRFLEEQVKTDDTTQEDAQPEEIIAYLAGKMKYHRIRVLPGDKVEVLIDPFGGKGRIVKRLR